MLHVHDLVDNVSEEAEIAGKAAAEYARNITRTNVEYVSVSATDGVRYALPQRVSKGEGKVRVFFRV